MVQKIKRRFFSSFSLLFGMILSLFGGAKSIKAQDGTLIVPNTIKETPQSITNFVTPSTIKESPQFLNPTTVKETPQGITTFVTPNTVKEAPLSINWLGVTMPQAVKESPQFLNPVTPVSIKIAPQGTTSLVPNVITPSSIEPQGDTGNYAPQAYIRSEDTPATQWFVRSSAYKPQVEATRDLEFENFVTQQGFQIQNLSPIELDAARTEYKLIQLERRLDQIEGQGNQN